MADQSQNTWMTGRGAASYRRWKMPFTTVLFVHLCALFAAFAASALVHHGQNRLASAGTAAEANKRDGGN